MAIVKYQVPESRRYFLKVFGRVEFEVTPDEYQRALTMALNIDRGANTLSTSFNTGVLSGTFKDPLIGEVKENAERP